MYSTHIHTHLGLEEKSRCQASVNLAECLIYSAFIPAAAGLCVLNLAEPQNRAGLRYLRCGSHTLGPGGPF